MGKESKQKYCIKCGFAILEADSFCGNCGIILKELSNNTIESNDRSNSFFIEKEERKKLDRSKKIMSTKTTTKSKRKPSAGLYMMLLGIAMLIIGITTSGAATLMLAGFGFYVTLFSVMVLLAKNKISWIGLYVSFYLISTSIICLKVVIGDPSRISEFLGSSPISLAVCFLILLSHCILLFDMYCKSLRIQKLYFIFFIEFIFFLAVAISNKDFASSLIIISLIFVLPSWIYFYNRDKYQTI